MTGGDRIRAAIAAHGSELPWCRRRLARLAKRALDVSLVGPRPDLPANLSAYRDDQLIRFAMPPGCTAWTFTRGAFDNDWATRQAINAEYVRVWSLRLDLEVIVGTAFVLLGRRATSPAVAEVPGQSHEPARMHR